LKTTAAVLVETAKPLVLADLEIPALKPGQVLVEISYSGVCQTQLLECRGYRGKDPYLPHCLGHEASGLVLEIGSEVTRCRADDRVILSWIKGSGADAPGALYDWNGRRVNSGGITTFSRHTVVSENRVTVMSDDIDPQQAALLGCAVPTGVGAVFNTAAPRPGQSIAIFGTGGVGLCSVMAAAISRTSPIIAVDVNPQRLEIARQVGATHTIDASTIDPVEEIREMVSGGVDFVIEASGRPEVMQQALAVVRDRGGTAVVIGNARFGERLEIDPRELNHGKRLLGTWGGDSQPDRDFPRYQDLLISGELDLQPLLSQPYPLSDINTALDDLESRKVARPLIDMHRE
jgi:S-(hydroxymethyl)glutathione dehydrogenase/alcohol dehydrogenase